MGSMDSLVYSNTSDLYTILISKNTAGKLSYYGYYTMPPNLGSYRNSGTAA